MKNRKQKVSVAIASMIADFLREENWKYEFDEKEGVYHTSVQMRNGLDSIDIDIHVYEDSFCTNAYAPITVSEEASKRLKMADFICRANYDAPCGGFKYDIQDGEILYHTFIPCYDITPSLEMVKCSLFVPIWMFDKYFNGILMTLLTDISAEDAVTVCEDHKTSEG